ncbi:pentapeptide repeat-containing protein [Pseudomonas oryzicola]|uniref:Pentapeptide repeat-containing protein n=1 Tax=Pseudomonas oryzicola TaxID=485876 RepID=A0ABS6QFJ3_9PSED|nr:pentapeptide repeat-containing protein [Pseudomonas oryzicola]MBV4492723.1 pentapeptide repeat-containing protein [Pseudomonas oryzicola]
MEKTFNKRQYLLLTACAEKGDFSDWNSYVGSTEDLIDLREANLENLKIVGAKFQNAQGEGANFNEAILTGAVLDGVDLSGSHFLNAELTGVKVSGSAFHDCIFDRAKLSAGTFTMCNFNGSRFHSAKLVSVEFWESNFQDSTFYAADLSDAKFYGGGYNPIARKELRFNLFGTSFKNAKFTSSTYFHLANVSRETDFRITSFESACYSTGLRQSLQYCNRRHNWNDWCENNGVVKGLLVKMFWLASDYGRSPNRVIISFFSISLIYTLLYFLFPLLTSEGNLSFIRSFYFSVVTMTTLGFGDIYANKISWLSQLVLVTHVFFGYILLGALLTVLSNLFTADGPSQGLAKHPGKNKNRITFSLSKL